MSAVGVTAWGGSWKTASTESWEGAQCLYTSLGKISQSLWISYPWSQDHHNQSWSFQGTLLPAHGFLGVWGITLYSLELFVHQEENSKSFLYRCSHAGFICCYLPATLLCCFYTIYHAIYMLNLLIYLCATPCGQKANAVWPNLKP